MPSQKTADITIDGDTYVIRKFNMSELRQLTEAFEKNEGNKTLAFDVLKIAMARAKLKDSDAAVNFELLEPDSSEINDAFLAIMKLTGMSVSPQKPPAPAPAPGADAQS